MNAPKENPMSGLTPETLAELQRLLDAATTRPWMVDVEGDEVVVIVDEGDEFSFTQIAADLHQGDDGHTDARLIVAAVNALPDLLNAAAELERIREGRDDSPRDEDSWPTSGQLWAMLLDSTPSERTVRLESALRAMDVEHSCITGLHQEAGQLRAELDRMTEERDNARAVTERLAAAVVRVRRECVAGKGYAGWYALAKPILAILDDTPEGDR